MTGLFVSGMIVAELERMATLQIDDTTFATWQARAQARGQSVMEWLREETTARPAQAPHPPPQGVDDWVAWLREFAARHPPTGAALDDSRESIYD